MVPHAPCILQTHVCMLVPSSPRFKKVAWSGLRFSSPPNIENLYATDTVRLFQSQHDTVETVRLSRPGCCDYMPTELRQSGTAVTVEGCIVT
jgi:hypothetical protein